MSLEGETVIVTEAGVAPGDPAEIFLPAADIPAGGGALRIELAPDGDPAALAPHFARAAVIRIPFRSFSDGRGFTLARELRRLGYRGRIRASGHLIPDQWPLARTLGIDEVEISAAQAERQPQWAGRTGRRRLSYLDVLR